MTDLMQKAIAELTKLPDDQQDNVAQWILAELADEERWDALFARSQQTLAILAKRALANHRSGQTQDLDPDMLE